jgi:DNA-binding HxlR family transcriptional regulator
MSRSATKPPCPIGRAVEVVGERWTLLIMRNASRGMTRFEDFRTDLGIADNVLSARLARLVDAGLLTRVPYRHDGGRTRHEYRLTQAGADMTPILRALADWGARHTEPAQPAEPMQFLHKSCGRHLTTPEARCEHCGREVRREEQLWLSPWRTSTLYRLAEPVTPETAPGRSSPDKP